MTAAIAAGAPSACNKDWSSINWSLIYKHVHRLQVRIAKAVEQARWHKVAALRRLLVHSYYAKVWAVRRVVTNKGKNTAGVDGVTWKTPKQKIAAVKRLRKRAYKPQPLRRIYIPKSNGKQRPLGIPTMKDRAMQALYALALKPLAESLADKNSYGFREKRSVADAIAQCFITLSKKASPQWILEADIKACFDEIDHNWLIENIPMDKQMLRLWLKAGYLEKGAFNQTDKGTPQGGIISPVIANMALDRLEATIKEKVARRGAKINVIRYADDFIVTGVTPDILINEVKPLVETFLASRGLSLSEEKTHLRSIDEGFDFLGFNIRKYGQKLLIKPSRAKVRNFMARIRGYIQSNSAIQADRFLRGLNSRLRGFANFYRHVVSKKTFNEVDQQTYQLLRNWMRRRHRNKTLAWCKKKYIKRWGMRWQFTVLTITAGKVKPVRLFKLADLPIIRHIKIQAEAHPYNPLYAEYFEQRRDRQWLRRKRDSRFLSTPAIERMVSF